MPSKSLYLLVHRSDATHTSYPLYDLGTLWHGRDRETSPLTWWMPATHSFRPAMSLSSQSFSPSSLSIPTDPPSICTARCGATLHIVLTLVPTHVAWCCDHDPWLDHPISLDWLVLHRWSRNTRSDIPCTRLPKRVTSRSGESTIPPAYHTHAPLTGSLHPHDTLSALGKQTDLIWTALLNPLQRVISPLECLQCCTALGTQLLETSYGNGSGNLPRTGNEASLRCDTCIAGRMKRASCT